MNRMLVIGLLVLAMPILAVSGLNAAPGKKVAVLIGVRNYNNGNFSNLFWTENDIVELGKILKEGGFEVTLLSDSQPASHQPTRANCLKHVEGVLKGRHRDDMVVFGFAGHGLQFAGDKANYFLPRDAEPNDSTTMISLKSIYEKLEDSGAGVKLMFVDACRNVVKDRFRSGLDGDTTPPPPKGVCALFSCSAGQSAMEINELKHGLFFYHLLDGLRGKAKDEDGDVTILRLADYASRQVKRAGFNQEPVLKGEVTNGVLVTAKPANELFNGKDLTGWIGLGGHWSVRDGMIVGKQDRLTFNTFLYTQKSYADFQLTCKVKLVDGKGNSGIQIRSFVIDTDKCIIGGPQVDMGTGYWGSLYGERSGGMMKASDKTLIGRIVKEADFNDYFIRVVGKRVVIKINGATTVDETFDSAPEKGVIALQLHAATAMEVIFKDFHFENLSK